MDWWLTKFFEMSLNHKKLLRLSIPGLGAALTIDSTDQEQQSLWQAGAEGLLVAQGLGCRPAPLQLSLTPAGRKLAAGSAHLGAVNPRLRLRGSVGIGEADDRSTGYGKGGNVCTVPCGAALTQAGAELSFHSTAPCAEQPEPAAAQTQPGHENQEEIRGEHICTGQEPRASTRPQQPLGAGTVPARPCPG